MQRGTEQWEIVHQSGERRKCMGSNVNGQIRARCGGAILGEGDNYKVAAAAGRFWRTILRLHFKTDSSTLWYIPDKALEVQHPRTVIYQTAVRVKVRTMCSSREDLARRAAKRWFHSGEHST